MPANDRIARQDAVQRRRRRPDQQYYAFLSYSHRDEELAEWLHGELEDFHVPAALAGRLTRNGVVPKRLAPIFRDEQELAAASDLGEEIRSALAASQFLIVLCSPHAARSLWTNSEIETFKRARPDGCVLAVIADGEPFASEIAGHEQDECFPPALRERYDKRGRPTGKKAEPLAADLRGDSEDRRVGFLKLVAGMLGVGLDDLVQRENSRRQKRLAWVSGASVLGMVVASGLAFAAIRSRDVARDQRREAEGLVAFMLGDLKDKLEPIGRLDALDGVGSKVLDYYRKQDASTLPDNALIQRSKALSLSAQVAYLRGNFTVAEKLYREAAEGTAEAVRRSPDSPERLFDHAQNVFYLGSLGADHGDLHSAERWFRDYGRLATRMNALDPNNLKWRMEGQYAAANLGFVLLRQRRFGEAERQFQSALRTIEAVAAVEPTNTDYQKSISESLAWLADSQVAQGKLAAAIGTRGRQVDLLARAAVSSSDVDFKGRLIPARQSLGNLLAAAGSSQALSQLRAAVDDSERLVPTEPGNSRWIISAGGAHLALARAEFAAGRIDEAKTQIASGCGYAGRLRGAAGAAPSQQLQRMCLIQKTQLALAQKAFPDAIRLAADASVLARSVRSADPVADRYALAESWLLVGDAYRGGGDSPRAVAAWAKGLSLAQAPVEQPRESAIRASLLERSGERAGAAVIRQRLTRQGILNVAIL